MITAITIRLWWEERRKRRAAKRAARMMVHLTLTPGALEAVRDQLAEDDWTERKEQQ